MSDEIRKILQMVEDKKISAEEAEKLMDAIDSANEPIIIKKPDKKILFIKVHVVENGEEQVNIDVPLSMAMGMVGKGFEHMQSKFLGNEKIQEIDWEQITDAVKDGKQKMLVNVEDENGKVQIYIHDAMDNDESFEVNG